MGLEKGRSYLLHSLLFIFIVIILSDIPLIAEGRCTVENSLAPIEPVVWIELDDDQIEVDVDTEGAPSGRVTGTVFCEIPLAAPPGYFVHVEIYTTTTLTWAFDFRRGYEEQEFREDIRLSKANSAYAPHYYSYWGTWQTESPTAGGSISDVICEVWALPFGEVRITDVGDIDVEENKWFDLKIPVENHGNCHADVTIKVESEEGVELEDPELTMEILEKTYSIFTVSLRPGPDSPEKGQIGITATSSIDGRKMRDTHTVHYQKDQTLIGPFTAPWVIGFLSSFALIILSTLGVILWRLRRKGKISTST